MIHKEPLLSELASAVDAADARVELQLLKGWHAVEDGRWRWTERQFSVALRVPQPGKDTVLQLKLALPQSSLDKLQSVTLTATVNGLSLPEETYSTAGEHVFARVVPGGALAGEVARVDFSLNKALTPGGLDVRELGVIVFSAGFLSM